MRGEVPPCCCLGSSSVYKILLGVTWVLKHPPSPCLLLLLRAKAASNVVEVSILSNCYYNICYLGHKLKHPPPSVTPSNIL